jgi:hypothetical protein
MVRPGCVHGEYGNLWCGSCGETRSESRHFKTAVLPTGIATRLILKFYCSFENRRGKTQSE